MAICSECDQPFMLPLSCPKCRVEGWESNPPPMAHLGALSGQVDSLRRELDEMTTERNLWMGETQRLRPQVNALSEVEAILKSATKYEIGWSSKGILGWPSTRKAVMAALEAIAEVRKRQLTEQSK